MVKEKDGLLGRLRGAFRPDVVAPEKEYTRRSAEERSELVARLFGGAEQEQEQEQEDADEAVGREARS
jgi:hypothetical protein